MFTARQQGPYRRLVEAAWAEHIIGRATLPFVPADVAAARDAWYRAELMKAAGIHTTKQAHPRRDYAKIMAHFEAIAKNGIYWQTQHADEAGRNSLHDLRKFCRDHEITDEYVDGTARQMFQRTPVSLTPGELVKLLMALRIHFKPTTSARRPASRATA